MTKATDNPHALEGIGASSGQPLLGAFAVRATMPVLGDCKQGEELQEAP